MKNRSRTPLSLIEITVMILVFSLCASVCMRLFVSASKKADQSRDLTNAVSWAQTAAETYKSCRGDLAGTARMLSAAADGDTARIHFDRDWNISKGADGSYVLTLTAGEPATVTVTDTEGVALFALQVKAVPYE